MSFKIVFVVLVLLLLAGCSQQVMFPSTLASPSDSEQPIILSAVASSPITKLFPSDPESLDFFGTAVAIEGDLAAVGHIGFESSYIDVNGVERETNNAGAVYVYEKDAQGQWQQQAILEQDTADGDLVSTNDIIRGNGRFGARIVISGDTIFVATNFRRLIVPQNQSYYGLSTGNYRGLVYIFKRNGNTWTQTDILGLTQLPNNISVGSFGSALALEGSTLVVGASGAQQRDPSTPTVNGGAFIYEEDASGNWNLTESIFVPQANTTNLASVALVGRAADLDGDTLVLGATHEAYVYKKINGSWQFDQALHSDDLLVLGQSRSSSFGQTVALSGDTVVVNSDNDFTTELTRTGAVYVFERQNGTWNPTPTRLEPNDPTSNNRFGFSLDLSDNALLVGSHLARVPISSNSAANSGAVYVYERDSSGSWLQQTKTIPPDPGSSQEFGYSLAREGNTLIVGARRDDVDKTDGISIFSGSAYLFDLIIDSSAPTLSPDITGTLGNNDWYTSDVDLAWIIQDDESNWLIDSGCSASSVISDTSGETFSCAVSSVGGSTSNTIVIKRDATGPSVSISGVSDGDSFDLGNEPAPECLTSDATSGVTTTAVLDIVSDTSNPADGTGQFTVQCSGAEDNAGNTASASLTYTVTAPADATPPVIEFELEGTLGANDWYVSDVLLTWTVTDDESEVTSSGCDTVTLSSDAAAVSYTCEASSEGGTSSETVTLKRDISAPNLTASTSPTANENGWHNSDVTVTYSCTDAMSGVDASSSSLATDAFTEGGVAAATCVDFAGNSVSTSLDIGIDKLKPVISASVSPAANAAGWYSSDVTVSFTCADEGSGILLDTASGSSVLTVEGAAQSVSSLGECSDLAGNQADAVSVSNLNLDFTAPMVTVVGVAEGAVYSSEPEVSCDSQDALSGVLGPSSVSLSGGATGLISATCSPATDNAGNQSDAVSVSYTIEEAQAYEFTGFFNPVKNLPAMNSVKAGRSIPIKFSLGADFGLDVFDAGFPRSQEVSCGSTEAISSSSEATASTSGLKFDSSNEQYSYNWKTDKAWKGSCREFLLVLDDGTTKSALFKFK